MTAVTAAAAAFLVHLTLRFENVRLGYDVGSARHEQRSLMETRRLLSLEAATLSQPERVELLARAMNMELPQANRIVMMLGGPSAPTLLRRAQ